MKAYYIYRAGRQPDGPYSPAQIVSMMERKEIPGAALVWCEGMNQWMPLYKVLDDIHSQRACADHHYGRPAHEEVSLLQGAPCYLANYHLIRTRCTH